MSAFGYLVYVKSTSFSGTVFGWQPGRNTPGSLYHSLPVLVIFLYQIGVQEDCVATMTLPTDNMLLALTPLWIFKKHDA